MIQTRMEESNCLCILLKFSDQDSDYSNDDEGMKVENNNPQPSSQVSSESTVVNSSNQNGFTPFVNQNVLVSSLPTQGTPLTVINELDDKKGKKKKKKTGK